MPGQRERQDHGAQRARAARAEVARRLDVGVGDALERRVDRQDHERQPDVREDDPHRGVRVRDPGRRQADLVQRPVEQPVRVEDQPPRVDAGEVRRPQRQQHEHEQHRPRAAAGDARHEVGERERDDRVGDGDRGGDVDRPQRDGAVGRLVPERAEVVERPVVDQLRRERVDRPERGDEQRDERRDVDERERQHRWRRGVREP